MPAVTAPCLRITRLTSRITARYTRSKFTQRSDLSGIPRKMGSDITLIDRIVFSSVAFRPENVKRWYICANLRVDVRIFLYVDSAQWKPSAVYHFTIIILWNIRCCAVIQSVKYRCEMRSCTITGFIIENCLFCNTNIYIFRSSSIKINKSLSIFTGSYYLLFPTGVPFAHYMHV